MSCRNKLGIASAFQIIHDGNIRDKIFSPEDFVADDFEVMSLLVVDGNKNRAVVGEEVAQKLQPRIHHGKPFAVLEIVVVMLEGGVSVIRRVNVNAFDGTAIEGQESFEHGEIVAVND